MTTTYSEPTVLWRLTRPHDGVTAQAIVVPSLLKSAMLWWCVNGKVERAEEFENVQWAVEKGADIMAAMLNAGWLDEEAPNARAAGGECYN